MSQQFLTDSVVKDLVCPSDKQQFIVWDSPTSLDGKVRHGAVGGLGVRVTRTGIKSFVHAYSFNGKRKRVVIGDAAVINVSSARLLIRKRELQIADGLNPIHENINYKRVHTVTLKELIDEYYAHKVSRLSIKYQYSFRSLVAPWVMPISTDIKGRKSQNKARPIGLIYGEIAAEQMTPSMILSYVEKIESDYRANSALQHLKALFNWGLRMQKIDMRNPCDPIDQRRIVKSRRDYSIEQIKLIKDLVFNPPQIAIPGYSTLKGEAKRVAALEAGQITSANRQLVELCNFMGILMLTMARPNELRNARFSHFDLEQRVWHKHDTKGLKLSRNIIEHQFRSVPVHSRVVDILIAQRIRWPDSEFVFPSHIDQSKPRDNFKRSLQRFKSLSGVPEYFQLYDLKRMAISLMMTGQGVSRDAVSHYVDHKGNLETTLIYDLGLVEPLRPVATRLGELLELED